MRELTPYSDVIGPHKLRAATANKTIRFASWTHTFNELVAEAERAVGQSFKLEALDVAGQRQLAAEAKTKRDWYAQLFPELVRRACFYRR